MMVLGTATPPQLTTRITRASAGARPCSGGTTGAGEATTVGIMVTVTCWQVRPLRGPLQWQEGARIWRLQIFPHVVTVADGNADAREVRHGADRGPVRGGGRGQHRGAGQQGAPHYTVT